MGLYILAIVIGYVLGNFTASYIVGKKMKNIDIREHGSGNAGATNTFRVLGLKAGIIVFVCDVIKGMAAALIGRWMTGTLLGGLLAGMGAVIGHDWPVVLNFKGGKGIATSFGLMIVLFPAISGILFIFGVTVILITRYVSLASISAAVLFPAMLAIFGQDTEIILIGALLSAIAILRHRTNIAKLLKGEENRIRFGKK